MGLIGFIFLITEEREVFGVSLDLQTLVFFIFTLLLGIQMIWFAILSKANSISNEFLPLDGKWEKITRLAKKDTFYLLYLLLIVIGVAMLLLQIRQWVTMSFGELDD